MAKCPKCGTKDAYIGLFVIKCANEKCEHYEPAVPLDLGKDMVPVDESEPVTASYWNSLPPFATQDLSLTINEQPFLPGVDWDMPKETYTGSVQMYDEEMYPVLCVYSDGVLYDIIPSSKERTYGPSQPAK